MQAFRSLTAAAVPFRFDNVDTDTILPARFMKTLTRSGLGAKLFFDLRYDRDGRERPAFALNRAPYRHARIIIAYENFGCGSSREHAPWALLDFGIRCVIAASFGDIFAANCYKNGILPVPLPREACEHLMNHAVAGALLTVDLERQLVVEPGGRRRTFAADAFRRDMLLRGEDDIDLTLRHTDLIADYEARQAEKLYTCTGSGVERREMEDA